MNLLEASGLHTYYGPSHVLHGVDFTVRAGEAVGHRPETTRLGAGGRR